MTPLRTTASLMLFRQDLRMTDNRALTEAVKAGKPLICLFVWDPKRSNLERPGHAAQWWLHHSLQQLHEKLQKAGNGLITSKGRLKNLVAQMVRQYQVTHIFWNHSFEPMAIKEERSLIEWGQNLGLHMLSYNGSLLADPQTFRNQSGKPYMVFTPFWNHLKKTCSPTVPHSAPRRLPPPPEGLTYDQTCFSSSFLSGPARARDWQKIWSPGEASAQKRLNRFIQHTVEHYQTGRDRPDHDRL